MITLPILAIDLGGTTTLLGLVSAGVCLPAVRIAARAAAGPVAWLDAVAETAEAWRGGYATAAVAVTGLIAGGRWWALNPAVLPVPPGFALACDRAGARARSPAHCCHGPSWRFR
jgi:N-acetylmannosamine-6-phosphate 2-epimerase / N-acetylmannosamine kinase